MTNSQKSEALPISKMIEDEMKLHSYQPYYFKDLIIPKVRQLETESIARAKEEERQRIIGILEERMNEYEMSSRTEQIYKSNAIKEVRDEIANLKSDSYYTAFHDDYDALASPPTI